MKGYGSLRIATRQGPASTIDLLRTEDLHRQSQTNYWQSVFRSAAAYADLQFVTGTLNQNAAGDLQSKHAYALLSPRPFCSPYSPGVRTKRLPAPRRK
jgi:hypothetical protein